MRCSGGEFVLDAALEAGLDAILVGRMAVWRYCVWRNRGMANNGDMVIWLWNGRGPETWAACGRGAGAQEVTGARTGTRTVASVRAVLGLVLGLKMRIGVGLVLK